MTYAEIKKMLQEAKLPLAYDHFAERVSHLFIQRLVKQRFSALCYVSFSHPVEDLRLLSCLKADSHGVIHDDHGQEYCDGKFRTGG
jgi:hypothetical protein